MDILSFNDKRFALEKRIRALAMDDPHTQTSYDEDPEVQHDTNDRACCVYISNFFTDSTNLIYYTRGTQNVKMFYSGMTGMQAFDGAILFSTSPLDLNQVLKPIEIKRSGHNSVIRLTKTGMPMEITKWRYLYETGRLIWGKSEIDLPKLQERMETRSQLIGSHEDRSRPSIGYAKSHDPLLTFTMSQRKRGKMKAIDSGDQVFGTEGREMRKDSVLHPEHGSGLNTVELQGQTAKERLNLEVFKRREQRSLDEIWLLLRDEVLQDKRNGEMASRIKAIERRQKELEQRRSKIHSGDGDPQIEAELAEQERNVTREKLQLLQRAANGAADQWRFECVTGLSEGLSAFRKRRASEDELRSWLVNLLIPPSYEDLLGRKISLDSEELQVVTDIAENAELERECKDRIKHTANTEELGDLGKLNMSLDIQRQIHVAQFVDAMFKYHGHVDNGKSTSATARSEDLNREGLSAVQEVTLANVLEIIKCCDRAAVIKLLQECDWVAEVALCKWCERDIDDDDALPPGKTVGRRASEEEAGPSSSKRRKPDSASTTSPEETLAEAQARLARILSGSPSMDQDE